MKFVLGDIWQFASNSAIGIPTNGFITSKGLAVMGAGLALQAKDRYYDIELSLSELIRNHGHCVGWLIKDSILSIPVKPSGIILEKSSDYEKILPRVRNRYRIGSLVPGFHARADINIIRRSLHELVAFIIREEIPSVHIPLLGCGYGDLDPDNDLWPILRDLNLPDSITLVRGYRTEAFL